MVDSGACSTPSTINVNAVRAGNVAAEGARTDHSGADAIRWLGDLAQLTAIMDAVKPQPTAASSGRPPRRAAGVFYLGTERRGHMFCGEAVPWLAGVNSVGAMARLRRCGTRWPCPGGYRRGAVQGPAANVVFRRPPWAILARNIGELHRKAQFVRSKRRPAGLVHDVMITRGRRLSGRGEAPASTPPRRRSASRSAGVRRQLSFLKSSNHRRFRTARACAVLPVFSGHAEPSSGPRRRLRRRRFFGIGALAERTMIPGDIAVLPQALKTRGTPAAGGNP